MLPPSLSAHHVFHTTSEGKTPYFVQLGCLFMPKLSVKSPFSSSAKILPIYANKWSWSKVYIFMHAYIDAYWSQLLELPLLLNCYLKVKTKSYLYINSLQSLHTGMIIGIYNKSMNTKYRKIWTQILALPLDI